ncbi:MAG: class I tRNA ligase family protein [Proteobacteria bacterium]|nr:class I tRNA ligase family protein [Pseudomonadota bacterium]
MTQRSCIVTLPPPTPNGGLHVGHLAGPFLASDAYTKASRLAGHPTFVTSYSDVNQSYVRVTAQRQGRDPAELASTWTADIRRTLDLYGCDVGEFLSPDAATADYTRRMFVAMYERGLLVRKPFTFFYSPARKAMLDEAGVSGYCPRCLDRCKCGICEACAFPNTAQTLLSPRDTLTGDTGLVAKTVDVLVLEVERHRDAIARYHAANTRHRPRYRWLVEDALRAPLADFPVSLPGDWGVAVDHPQFVGQVINPWAEVMSNFVYCYERAATHLPGTATPQVVNFFGYDNSYFYAIVHVALMDAADCMQWAPHAVVINEFYNLDHGKFSTSANHVLWAGDVAQRHDPDAVRLFCALNSPGFEKGNFNEPEMARVVESRLAAPWRRIARLFNERLAELPDRSVAADVALTAAGRHALRRVLASYGAKRFHLRQAAEDILHLQAYLLDSLESPADATQFRGIAYLVKCLAQAMYPIAPGVAQRMFAAVSTHAIGALDEADVERIAPLPAELFLRVEAA